MVFHIHTNLQNAVSFNEIYHNENMTDTDRQYTSCNDCFEKNKKKNIEKYSIDKNIKQPR